MDKPMVRDHILRQLGIIGAGETPSNDDASLVERVMDNCHEELEQMEVATWAIDDIPGFAVESFSRYCKASLTAFGQDYDPAGKFAALKELRYITADRRNGVGKATYY